MSVLLDPPLKIFSDRKLLGPDQAHEILFYPFWGDNREDPNDPNTGRFVAYEQIGRQLFTMTDLQHCDIAVLPYQWRGLDSPTSRFLDEARKAGKPVAVFFNHDSTEDIPVDNGFIFRTSFYRSKRKPNEFAMPGWSEDFVERHFSGVLPLRDKSSRPVVSYCGYGGNWKFELKKLLGRPLHPGMEIRVRALKVLASSKMLHANLRIRNGFWAGMQKPGMTPNPDEVRRVRREFVDSIAGSDYVLCTRGAGNFSYRFYETLSLGRIPLFIDTDCVLPYERSIDWKNLCVWVNASEIDRLDQKVAEFHNRISPDEFRHLQQRCRAVWEEWIRPAGFFRNLRTLLHL